MLNLSPVPVAAAITCGYPGAVLNGGLPQCADGPELQHSVCSTSSRFPFGASAMYGCNTGYNLQGSSNRTCATDGFWTPSPPRCNIVRCPPLANIANGTVAFPVSTQYLDRATYQCDMGHFLVGEQQRICTASGDWSSAAPRCEIFVCNATEVLSIENGRVFFEETTFDAMADIICDVGYNLIGENVSVCNASGFWEPSIPVCEIADCGPPEFYNNTSGMVMNNVTTFNSSAFYDCNVGYDVVNGSNERTCLETGMWSSSPLLCEGT